MESFPTPSMFCVSLSLSLSLFYLSLSLSLCLSVTPHVFPQIAESCRGSNFYKVGTVICKNDGLVLWGVQFGCTRCLGCCLRGWCWCGRIFARLMAGC